MRSIGYRGEPKREFTTTEAAEDLRPEPSGSPLWRVRERSMEEMLRKSTLGRVLTTAAGAKVVTEVRSGVG